MQKVKFTEYQLTILQAWADYPTVDDIAVKLGISQHTIKTHLKRMRKKLDVHRTFDVYRYALMKGLLHCGQCQVQTFQPPLKDQ